MAWVVVTLVILSTTKISVSQVFDGPDLGRTMCEGSLFFFKNSVLQASPITYSYPYINLRFDSVKVSGCKCFVIFNRIKYRGQTFYLYPDNTYPISEDGFNRVRSIKEIKCYTITKFWYFIIKNIIKILA